MVLDRTNIQDNLVWTKCLMNFGAGPYILQGYEVVGTSYSIK